MFFSRILAGVPKFRTSKPKVLKRRFAPLRVLSESPLGICPECRTVHLPWVCCMSCYQVLRDQTEAIKRRMVNYNPYIGQRQKPMQPFSRGESAEKATN